MMNQEEAELATGTAMIYCYGFSCPQKLVSCVKSLLKSVYLNACVFKAVLPETLGRGFNLGKVKVVTDTFCSRGILPLRSDLGFKAEYTTLATNS
jgi:hypothetical protein